MGTCCSGSRTAAGDISTGAAVRDAVTAATAELAAARGWRGRERRGGVTASGEGARGGVRWLEVASAHRSALSRVMG